MVNNEQPSVEPEADDDDGEKESPKEAETTKSEQRHVLLSGAVEAERVKAEAEKPRLNFNELLQKMGSKPFGLGKETSKAEQDDDDEDEDEPDEEDGEEDGKCDDRDLRSVAQSESEQENRQ